MPKFPSVTLLDRDHELWKYLSPSIHRYQVVELETKNFTISESSRTCTVNSRFHSSALARTKIYSRVTHNSRLHCTARYRCGCIKCRCNNCYSEQEELKGFQVPSGIRRFLLIIYQNASALANMCKSSQSQEQHRNPRREPTLFINSERCTCIG